MSRQYFNLNSTTNTNQNFMSFVENDNVLNYLNDFDFTEQEDKNSSNMNFLEIQQEQRMDE